MDYPQQTLNFILDLVFPISCIGCGCFSPQNRREYLCQSCSDRIAIKRRFKCIGCKRNSPLGKTCIECEEYRSIDNLFLISDYKNPLLEKALKVFKYRFVADMAELFRRLLKKYILWLSKEKNFNLIADNPIIIPMPLYPRRLNWRGFNQAEIIAQFLADLLQQNIQTNILIRIKETKPQADIKQKDERLKNPKNKFKIINASNIKNRNIILVDDICTTGATLNECARLLKEAKARKIVAFVIARG